MKKVALVFVLAVIGPSLVLAWLAVLSLADQQFLLERQHSLLYQNVVAATAKALQAALEQHLRSPRCGSRSARTSSSSSPGCSRFPSR